MQNIFLYIQEVKEHCLRVCWIMLTVSYENNYHSDF